MGAAQQTFPHRRNADSFYDSICLICYKTISTQKNEADLAEEERRHAVILETRPSSS